MWRVATVPALWVGSTTCYRARHNRPLRVKPGGSNPTRGPNLADAPLRPTPPDKRGRPRRRRGRAVFTLKVRIEGGVKF